eukprot:4655988-Prymnesium_polylepis.1
MMQITLDDETGTRIQSISQLKDVVCSMHKVSCSADAWKSVFHGNASLHALQKALDSSPACSVEPPAAVEDPGEDSDDDPD